MATLHFTPIILAHMAAAFGAVVTGAAMLVMKKGTTIHRQMGRTWVVLMAATALVSFWIQSRGHFSWIHLLSVISLVLLARAIQAVIKGNIRTHQRAMTGVYVGLVTAGIFTLLPGRRLGDMTWQALGLT